ncbi:mitochondrial cardiolipin synthase [Andalucia godoyi]|uniref:Mitochondrial cardiolipin synthase n=1 Tax=Andalucia godoyi TaxID=505711 RepID=A0A8K0AHA0_ANDGO|nr:mitochondrial cardiolipin synthase [Andalucia godoyi]|eukprot:ANDGO_03011.mRNA.1 mitochondrial cardiolipin synthase
MFQSVPKRVLVSPFRLIRSCKAGAVAGSCYDCTVRTSVRRFYCSTSAPTPPVPPSRRHDEDTQKHRCNRMEKTPSSTNTNTGSDNDNDTSNNGARGPENVPLMSQLWTVPNLLTYSRMLATPVIGYWVLSSQYSTALCALAAVSITDVLDGYLARRLGQTTVLGSYLDPIADKLLMATMALSLTYADLIHWQLVALVVLRDACLVAGSFIYKHHILQSLSRSSFSSSSLFPSPSSPSSSSSPVLNGPAGNPRVSFIVLPSLASKINTLAQLSLMTGALATAAQVVPGGWISAAECIVAATTLWSGIGYARHRGIKVLVNGIPLSSPPSASHTAPK